MGISTQKILRLTFNNAGGSTFSISLPQPKEDLTNLEIETAMDLVIAKNIFTGRGGDLTGKQDIKVIDTTTNDFFDPA